MQISPKIHLLKHHFELEYSNEKKVLSYVNSIIIFGKQITLVDTGVKNSWQAIFDYIRHRGRKPEEISRLILSHSHSEQIGSANKIKELTNCKVLAHIDEREWYEDIDKQFQHRPSPGFYNLVDKSVTIDKYIEHQQLLSLDEEITCQFFHRPGYSKGTVNLYFMEDGTLFTANSIPVKGGIPNYDNYLDLVASLKQIKAQKDAEILIGSSIEPIYGFSEIENTINEIQEYLKKLDVLVKINYTGGIEKILEHCSAVINDMKLPEYYVLPIVDKAFRSHLG